MSFSAYRPEHTDDLESQRAILLELSKQDFPCYCRGIRAQGPLCAGTD
jgi:hypothetical protein